MKRIPVFSLFSFILVLVMVCLWSCVSEEKSSQPPNVLFIISDDLGDRLSCYGDPVALTPHLDDLAGQGVVFANSFCQYPTCGPSRASLFSGLYPFEIGYLSNGANGAKTFNEAVPNIKSLPRLFRENGYFTARVGKIFHMGIPGGIGKPGKDDTLAWDVAINNKGIDASPKVWENATHVGNTRGSGTRVVYDALNIDDEQMSDGQGLNAAIQLLKDNHPQATGKPFFMAYGIYRPHPPLIVPEKHWDAIEISEYSIPFVPAGDREDIPAINFHLPEPGFNFIPDSHAINYAHAYYASIHFVDELAGKLIQELNNQGLDNNTIVVFTGDQGFHLGEHGHWHKSTLFEQACRVPLIIYDPRQKEKGKVCTNLVGLIDIYPTLCELTGIEPPHKLSGTSLVPQLHDVSEEGSAFQITMGAPDGFSIRTEQFRYTEWRRDWQNIDYSMLYDLDSDPNEYVNQNNNPEYEELIKELSAKLDILIQNSLHN